ncbi:MAG: aldo/keto reductase [Acidobacteria bacterium]|nr:aldo/keto reductase [Acidobacteriota bacterium]
MDYVNLGPTGLKVSRITLGCMSYGVPARGRQSWSIDRDDAVAYFRQALDAGINSFDTANVYSDGTSEEITGAALLSMVAREEVVIATKVNGRMNPSANGMGLSRKAILAEIDHSLRRLGTDYVDLYQIHRWDYETPIEETLEALHDVVRAGKVRYIGASSMYAWQFAQALYVADLNGWTRFVSMQNYYNLLYREEEREMLPLCEDQGIGVIPWSPLARGRLTRPWESQTARSESDEFGTSLYGEVDKPVVDAVIAIAANRGVPPAQIALAWVLAQSVVTSPIIGATKAHHIDDAVAAMSIELDDAEIAALEGSYQPHPVMGLASPTSKR